MIGLIPYSKKKLDNTTCHLEKTTGNSVFCVLIGGLLTLSGLPMALDVWGQSSWLYIAYRFKWQLSVPKHTLTFIQLTLGTSVD